METNQVDNKENLGTRRLAKLRMADFPNADEIVRQGLLTAPRSAEAVDVLLVNPPTPDGGYWIRTQHRVGRRTRENMVWPQVSLAQMAALLHPTYKVKIIDANAERMSWEAFGRAGALPAQVLPDAGDGADAGERHVRVFSGAGARGEDDRVRHARDADAARDDAAVSGLDFVLVGEPDLTIRDLIDHLEGKSEQRPEAIASMLAKNDPSYAPSLNEDGERRPERDQGAGLAARRGDRRELPAAVHRGPGRPADAAARAAAAGEVPDADDEGAVHVHRDEPRLSGGLHLLHQARQLPVQSCGCARRS